MLNEITFQKSNFRKTLIQGATLLLVMTQVPTAGAQQRISVLTSAATAVSHTGWNAYVSLGAAYKRHVLYIGPKAVLSKSYIPGKILWGLNAGYLFSVIDQERWNTMINVDYQNVMYRAPATTKYNTIHEMTGGLCLNYFPIPQRLSIGLTLGAGIFMENYYSKYSGSKGSNSGLMQQIRFGITYKISNE